MNDFARDMIVVVGLILIGVIAGYALAEVLETNDCTITCNQQCNEYIKNNCGGGLFTQDLKEFNTEMEK